MNKQAIAIIDLSNATLTIYDIPDELDGEQIEEWIRTNTNHRLSESSWGAFNGMIDDQREDNEFDASEVDIY